MRKSTVLAAALAASFAVAGTAAAETFKVDPAHSFVTFEISHLGFSTLQGRFNKMEGQFTYDAAKPAASTVEVKVDPTDPREVATREELTRRVIDAIKDAGVEGRSFVHSFDWAVLELARDIDPSLVLSALMVPGMPVEDVRPWTGSLDPADFPDEVAAAAALGASVFSPYWTWCTPDNVARTHDLGLAVLPWTVNEVADLEAMKAAGVDGLVTDYPDRWTAV